MIVGYDARNIFRNSSRLGDYCRELVATIAQRHIGKGFQAMLYAPNMNGDYRTFFISNANVGTYKPKGKGMLASIVWHRFKLNPVLMDAKVKLYHGLNEELPYGIGRDIKTVITCYGLHAHKSTSFIDSIVWRHRMRYAFRASNIIVAVSDEVRDELVQAGVNEAKIRVIPMSADGTVGAAEADAYYAIYEQLVG
ncbi:MAG: glycosyltransferase [Bacteroidales bacterium]|nr:glycosyltransferase [Bacteroidales bacterium]